MLHREPFDWQAQQEQDEQELAELGFFDDYCDVLDFDHHDADEHPEWQTNDGLSDEDIARIESDAEIFDYRLNGYD